MKYFIIPLLFIALFYFLVIYLIEHKRKPEEFRVEYVKEDIPFLRRYNFGKGPELKNSYNFNIENYLEEKDDNDFDKAKSRMWKDVTKMYRTEFDSRLKYLENSNDPNHWKKYSRGGY